MTATVDSIHHPYIRSSYLIRRVINPLLLWLGAETLVVRGRRSGRIIRMPLPAFEFGGTRYLVAAGGDTHWARNLRAAGQGELWRGRNREHFRAVETVGWEHDRVVAAYREEMSWRAGMFFSALPEVVDQPAFRIERIGPDPVA